MIQTKILEIRRDRRRLSRVGQEDQLVQNKYIFVALRFQC